MKDYAYVSFSGNNLRFNISLAKCSTLSCTIERSAASGIGKLNADKNQSDTNNIDTSIFIPISIGLTLLGIATYGTIFCLRKFA